MIDVILQFLLIALIPGGGLGYLVIKFIKIIRNSDPYERLFFSFSNARFVIENKKMLKCVIGNYTRQKLAYLNRNDDVCTTQDLCKRIRKHINRKNEYAFLILGGAGTGKSSTMRYLFCKLTKPKLAPILWFKFLFVHSIYIPMRDIESKEKLKEFIDRHKEQWSGKKQETAVLFLDGLDESILFEQIAQNRVFYEIFKEIKDMCSFKYIHLIASARTEFFYNKNIKSLSKEIWNGNEMQIYELMKLNKNQILSIYKGLDKVKKIETKEGGRKHFQSAYPDKYKNKNKYLIFFRKILDQSRKDGELNSIFQCPIFIRYAYQYMGNLNRNKNIAYNDDNELSNSKKAFDIIVDKAILKWDYHVFYVSQAVTHEEHGTFHPAFISFLAIIRDFFFEIISETIRQDDYFIIPRELLEDRLKLLNEKIINNHPDFLRKEFINKEFIPNYILYSHCLFIESPKDGYFEFAHRSFHEYFIAEYLSKIVASPLEHINSLNLKNKSKLLGFVQKEDFLSSPISDIAKYYLGFLEENNHIRNSISNFDDVVKLKKNCIEVSEFHELKAVNLYMFFPWVKEFHILGKKIPSEIIEMIFILGRVDLENIKANNFDILENLCETKQIKELVISGSERYLNVTKSKFKNEFINLKRMDIRSSSKFLPVWLKSLENITNKIEWLHVAIFSKTEIKHIYQKIIQGKLKLNRISFKMQPYSELYFDIYCVYRKLFSTTIKAEIVIDHETITIAKKQYWSDFYKKKGIVNLLTIIYNLEYAVDPSSPATIYDGLSLCQYYLNIDSIDEDEKAYKIYTEIRPKADFSDHHIQYLYRYGIHQVSKDYEKAERMLESAYDLLPVNQKIVCARNLLKVYIFKDKLKDQKTLNLLDDLRKLLDSSSSDIDSEHIDFYYYDMVVEIMKFRKIKEQYNAEIVISKKDINPSHFILKNASITMEKINKHLKAVYKIKNPNRYFDHYYYCSLFVTSLKFFQFEYKIRDKPVDNYAFLNKEMKEAMIDISNFHHHKILYNHIMNNEVNERERQACFHMFKGSSMLWFLFTEEYDLAIEIANELLHYKHRKDSYLSNACEFIIYQAQKRNLDFDIRSKHYDGFTYILSEWLWI